MYMYCICRLHMSIWIPCLQTNVCRHILYIHITKKSTCVFIILILFTYCENHVIADKYGSDLNSNG